MIEDFIYPLASKYKSLKNMQRFIFLFFMYLYCISCTYNPLFPLKKTEQTTISGTVTMGDWKYPEGTFVWMEGFNLYTYLDREGDFEFTLSPAVSQGLDGGVTGIFAIYFYHPNYLLDSVHVKLVNGKIAKNQASFDDFGVLKSDMVLTKFFSHTVTIDTIGKFDEYVAKSEDDSLRITVKVKAYTEKVTVRCRIWNKPVPGTSTNVLRRSAVYFYSEEYNHLYEYLNINSFYYEYYIPAGMEYTWSSYILPLWDGGFYNTDYQVVPYIYPIQKLPSAMLYHMGMDKIEFTPEYLQLPLQVDTCVIHIDGILEE